MPQIEVTFDIDANGILNVSAKDKATNKEQKITIQGSTGLSDEEIDRMVKDAEAHKADDEKRKNLVEAKNQAENLVYTTEKTLKDLGDKVDSAKKSEAENLANELKELIKTSQNTDEIKSKSDALNAKLQEIGAAAYQQSGAQAQPNPEGPKDDSKGPDKKNDDDVIEGQVENN
jgi:molecular chaperone DnaK